MNVLEITLKNKQINEILQDDVFIRAFEYVNESGFVTCSMLQRKCSISYPKASAFYEVMSLFKGAEYDKKTRRMKVKFSEETIERVKNKEIKADKRFKRINYLDDQGGRKMKDRTLGDGIARQELNLLFVIDNSGSMEGEKIGAVNNAIRDVMTIMPEIQEDTSDAIIKISALKFSDKAEWIYTEPKDIGDFKWKDLSTEGGTNLSEAYDALSGWLCKREKGGQMPDLGGIAPIIILMTDGMPTSFDWEKHLDELKKKGWYRVALKYALAIGIDTDEAMDVLRKFTGNPETVLKVYTAEALRKVIKVIAVTASKVKSNSASTNGGGVAGAVADNNHMAQEQIAEKLEEVKDIEW